MGFKERGYTREVPQEKVRDYSLFAIATEGSVREPEYFLPFDGIERIKVDIIEPEPDGDEDHRESAGSSPSQVLKRVREYIDKYQLSAENGDSLWCVIDKDRWPQEQIEELHAFCTQKVNWHLVISNPCIEVWLLYHKMADLTGLGITEAKDAKRALGEIDGGYYYIKYLPLMLDVIKNASRADSMPEGWMPGLLETKVYHLGRALYERMGKVSFDKFVAYLPQLDREVRGKKVEKRR